LPDHKDRRKWLKENGHKLCIQVIFLALAFTQLCYAGIKNMDIDKQLTPEEQRVILQKGTEAPFSGKIFR